ncbi:MULTISPECIES: DUF488 domain-containing protein [unclassified Thioalkalivibrio]|uniref:DUF488 domain-containing protein n=1 Tax=unclassified Thioalkalivibrio TaxID=2621013 RepID=UPI00036DCA0F|nr:MULTISPECIES: DUF488 domain-containing protein [unclassified Thioalkalivibrio]
MDRVRIRRVYDPVGPDDGFRVLVDRLWPRGVKKSTLAPDAWEKSIAPSPELRRWFGHDPGRWRDFCRRYQAELGAAPEAWGRLLGYARRGRLTLLTATRDVEHSHAAVLRDLLNAERAEEEHTGERASPVCFAPDEPGGDPD